MEFWQVVVTLTGVSGVAAFVLWSLYKDWLHLEALATLTTAQRFSLFKFFLLLTFLFALALVGLAVYRQSLEKPIQSAREMSKILSVREAAGRRFLDELAAEVEADGQRQVREFADRYHYLMTERRKAIFSGDIVLFDHLSKQLRNEVLFDRALRHVAPERRVAAERDGCLPSGSPFLISSSMR